MKKKWENLSEAEKLIVAGSIPFIVKLGWRFFTVFLGIGIIALAFII